MANLVNLESVSKSYGVRNLLDGVSLGVAEGDRPGQPGPRPARRRRDPAK
jgi:ATP-binding cassette subfamily F protein uup